MVSERTTRLIGMTGPMRTAEFPLERDTLRRFCQAVMEPASARVESAAARDGDLVFPPLFPVHALPRPSGSPDPFGRLVEDPDWDGIDLSAALGGLPAPHLRAATRLLNGGVEAEFFQLAAVGDVISAQSRYLNIYEREGKAGPMLFIVVETSYTNHHEALLARVRSTIIAR